MVHILINARYFSSCSTMEYAEMAKTKIIAMNPNAIVHLQPA